MRYAMIMAGGSGTRLWPMSRARSPKQLLPFIGGRSLLALAAERLDGLIPHERRLICAGEGFRGAIRTALPQFTDGQLLGEPTGRDTVNAVGFTAAVLAKRDPAAVFAVLTADHLIEPRDAFQRSVEIGFRLVENDPSRLVTFSIKPTHPATGYGYVERGEAVAGFPGAFHALRFVEKPDAAAAQKYLDAGTFGWNSGMFVFSATTIMEALARFLPESHRGLERIAVAWGRPDQQAVLGEVYPALKKISVDYAIMEPASRDPRLVICTVPMELSWMDVGSWPSYAETLAADGQGHRSNMPGSVVHLDSRSVLAVSDDPAHVIATIGCENLIIVHTPDATLVCAAAHAERVKELAGRVDPSLQ